jgi:glycosyltransferase involved in cell wall biosynthesis
MLEAIAAGMLVVGLRTPPVERIISDGKTGHLVDFFDRPGWCAALAEAQVRPEDFQAMREAGRARIRDRYDMRSVCLPQQTALLKRLQRG